MAYFSPTSSSGPWVSVWGIMQIPWISVITDLSIPMRKISTTHIQDPEVSIHSTASCALVNRIRQRHIFHNVLDVVPNLVNRDSANFKLRARLYSSCMRIPHLNSPVCWRHCTAGEQWGRSVVFCSAHRQWPYPSRASEMQASPWILAHLIWLSAFAESRHWHHHQDRRSYQ